MRRLHLVDGTYELFRAYYSKRPDHVTPDGRPAKGVVGLATSLLGLLHDSEEDVTHIAIAFDNPVESFRNEVFDGYKTGEGMEPELAAQMEPAEEAAAALGLVVWRMGEWEADDALATAAARWAKRFDQVRILTPDKDLGQCIRGTRVVQVDRRREKVIDQDALKERRGIAPESIPDFLALVGDTADGIPGLPRFGEKTAAGLLGVYPHLEDIPEDVEAWKPQVRGAARLGETLRERWADALLYRRLATLVTDVPLAEKLGDLKWKGVPRASWESWCERVGADRLKTRPRRWAQE